MALGALFILFIVMSVISILGILFLYLSKNQTVKKVFLYGMALWGMVIAYMNATALPTNFVAEQVITWIIGFVGVAGIIVNIKANTPKGRMIAQLLVTAAVVVGIARLFFS